MLLKDSVARRDILTDAFKKTNTDLVISNIDIIYSGTTAVVIMLVGDTLICSNVGDSRITAGEFVEDYKKHNTSPTGTGESPWKAKQISRDHKPDLPEEYDRIIKSNGRVASYQGNVGIK